MSRTNCFLFQLHLVYCVLLSSNLHEITGIFHSMHAIIIFPDKSKGRNSSDKKEPGIPKEPTAHIAAQTFTFRDLAAATKNFRPECLLGEGGFGRVYKGKLESGQVC